MTDTNRDPRNDESRKPLSQDAVGILCILCGGFFAVSGVQALRGQEPRLAPLARPVLGLIELIGHWPALVFCLGLAALGCMMFLKAHLVDVWRPLGLASSVALGLSFFLAGFVPDAGGAIGGALPSILSGLAGKLASALVGGLVLLVAVWWGVLAQHPGLEKKAPLKPANKEAIERPDPAGTADGVSAAEAAFLLSEPRESGVEAKPGPAPTVSKEGSGLTEEPALPFGTRPLTTDEPAPAQETAPASASLDAEAPSGGFPAEPLDVQHDDPGLEPAGADLAQARARGGEPAEAQPSGEARALASQASPVLPSWAAEEADFDEHGLSEPSAYEPPSEDEGASAATAASEEAEVEEAVAEEEYEYEEEGVEAAHAEEEGGDEEEYEEEDEEEDVEAAHAEDDEEWEYEEEEEYEEEGEEVVAEAALPAEASWEESSVEQEQEPRPAAEPAAEIDGGATNGAVQPLEGSSAPQAPGWEAEETPEVVPVAATGAPPAHGVRQESLFEEVDLEEEDALKEASAGAGETEEEAPAEAAHAEDSEEGEDSGYEECAEEEEQTGAHASEEEGGDEEWEWEYEYEEEEESEGAVASASAEEDEQDQELEEEEAPAEGSAEEDPTAEAEESEPEVVLQPTAAEASSEDETPEPVPAFQLKDDIDQLVYDSGVLILDEGRVAVSMLQRKFTIDFDQACELLDSLQELGLIGPYQGGRKREVLLSKEEWVERVSVSA